MRRAERSSARILALAVAGALLFVVGYFAGSRYASPRFEGLVAVVLPEPQPLALPAGLDPDGAWQLLATGDLSAPACRAMLTRLVRIHNRLAGRRDLQEALQLSFLAAPAAKQTAAAGAVPRIVPTTAEAARSLARQLGEAADQPLDCRATPLGLVDAAGRLRALLPAGIDPEAGARDLARLLDELPP